MKRGAVGIVGIVGCLVLVACTSASDDVDSGVSESIPATDATTDSRSAPPTSDAIPTTDPGGGSGTVEKPDPTGLTSISEPDPDVVEGLLDNGLRYVIRSNDNPGGRVDMRLVIDAGSVDEDPDQSGVAHFLEHMLFNGTEEFPENELIATLRRFGASFGADINAYTSYDETVYELTMPTRTTRSSRTGMTDARAVADVGDARPRPGRGRAWRGARRMARVGDDCGRAHLRQFETLLLTGSAYEGRVHRHRGSDQRDDLGPARSFLPELVPTGQCVRRRGRRRRSRTIQELIRAEFDPVTTVGDLTARPENRAEVSDGAGGDRALRSRRGRGLRQRHPARSVEPAGPPAAGTPEAAGQRVHPRCDRVPDRRDAARE